MIIKIIKEGQAKDLILEYALKMGDKTISAHEIQKEILPELSSYRIEFLFEKIQSAVNNVADVAISEYACLITTLELQKYFIKKSGDQNPHK